LAAYETLIAEQRASSVTLLLLNRPHAANALNTVMGVELGSFFEDLAAHPSKSSCIVLSGAGESAFCAGGDLKERNSMSDEAWLHQHRIFERAFRAILFCPVPIIAAVNGAAFGGGCELALACDWAYASETARFAQTETRLGIMPGGGGTQTLPRAAGVRRAKELILTGRTFSADEAKAWGVVNEVFPAGALMTEAQNAAEQVAASAPLAVRQAKLAIDRSPNLSLSDGLAFEIEAYNRTALSADRREGVAAFNEARPPRWGSDNS
jgi:enoyl-CoA hydratase